MFCCLFHQSCLVENFILKVVLRRIDNSYKMHLFPIQYSTLSASALNDHLQSAFGLMDTTTTFLVRNVSDTYVVNGAQSKYILKIYRRSHRSQSQIQAEVDLLNYLKQNNARVAYPVANKKGSHLQKFNTGEGERYGVLFSYAPGKVSKDLTDSQLRVLGREMAFNHELLSKPNLVFDRPEYTIESTILQPLKVLQPMFERFDYQEGQEQLQEIAKRTIASFETVDTRQFGFGYCHYDYMPKNFHFTDSDEITFFDWDFAGKGFLVNDLLSFQIHFFFHVTHGATSKEQASKDFQTFVDAYREHRDISDSELSSIPMLGNMFWIFYLAVQYQGFDDFSNPYFNQSFIKQWLNRMVQWEKFCNS